MFDYLLFLNELKLYLTTISRNEEQKNGRQNFVLKFSFKGISQLGEFCFGEKNKPLRSIVSAFSFFFFFLAKSKLFLFIFILKKCRPYKSNEFLFVFC